MGDIELLFLLATFFMYHRVASSLAREFLHIQIDFDDNGKREIRDEGLGVALQLVLTSGADAVHYRSIQPTNFHEYRCSGPGVR
jgi:hypothetical protein